MMQLNNKYNRNDFLQFLAEDFITDFKKDVRPASTQGLSSIQKAYSLGRSERLDLQVFEFSFEGSPNKRVTLTKDAFKVMRSYAVFQALAIFHSPNSDDWRLSLMTATPERTEKGKVALLYSNPKRLSFFLGPNAKVNTPTKFLLKRGTIIDFDDLKSRFSLEVVNKEFYTEISRLFTQLVGGSVQNSRKMESYKALLRLPDVQDHNQTSLEFAVRLIGRVIFCWFLREKRSNQGKSLMPNVLLSLEAVKNNPDYYHKVLEPIFFEVLNKPGKSRKVDLDKEPFSSIPYLNGGLFSPHDDDFFSYNEGKQTTNHNVVVVPDEWLYKFFEVLETYNFTIDENTSFDEELSIDPEMLGRIFENLLAEINPETGESARKSTGSYYTPRVIVDYMVDESLLLYLKSQTHIDEEKLRAVISYDLNDDEKNPLTMSERERIINALEKVRILDPACGSGAFPIGALQKIVFILQQTDPEGQLWFKKQIKNTPPELRKMFEQELADKNFDYIRKLGIIRENIYGVDIQPIATEISRLRCFLTLVVDQQIKENLENRGIQALPNLDFKFVTANGLVGLPQLDQPKDKLHQLEMIDDREKINELKDIRDEYFNASGLEREQLKTAFVMAQKKLVNQLIEEHGYIGVKRAELTQKLTDWEPFTHKPTSWFDAEWMFGNKEGFDIIIANPPYISHDKIDCKDHYKFNYKSYEPFADLYCYFIELALNLQSKSGILCYITSNSFLRADYGSPLRHLIMQNNDIAQIINIDDYQIFDSAIVNTSVLLTCNHKADSIRQAKIVNTSFHNVLNFTDFINKNCFCYEQSDFDESSWTLITPEKLKLKRKIKTIGKTLDEMNTKIRLGLATGSNEVFLINEEKRRWLVNQDPRNEEVIKPILRGKDIFKYGYKSAGLYIILTKNGINVKSDYPYIYSYLDSFGEGFKKRGAQGQNWWNLRACAFFDDFKKEKIIWIELNDDGRFALSTDEIYLVNSAYFLIPPHGFNSKYLLAILNSSVIRFYLSTIAETSGMGVYRWINNYVKEFPIPRVSLEDQENIIDVVNQILELTLSENYVKDTKKQEQVKEYEKQIDQLVYGLYGLAEEDIRIVEGKAHSMNEAEAISASVPAIS